MCVVYKLFDVIKWEMELHVYVGFNTSASVLFTNPFRHQQQPDMIVTGYDSEPL